MALPGENQNVPDVGEAHRNSVEKLLQLVEGHNSKLLSIENRFKRFKNEFDDIKTDLKRIWGCKDENGNEMQETNPTPMSFNNVNTPTMGRPEEQKTLLVEEEWKQPLKRKAQSPPKQPSPKPQSTNRSPGKKGSNTDKSDKNSTHQQRSVKSEAIKPGGSPTSQIEP